MKRAALFLAIWLSVSAAFAQQPAQPAQTAPSAYQSPTNTPPPADPNAVLPADPNAPTDPNTPVDPNAAPPAEEKPAPVDPKTGRPLSPDEIREREIDKYDPLKPFQQDDPTQPDPNRRTDMAQPEAATPTPTSTNGTNNNNGSTPLPGSVAASNAAGNRNSGTGQSVYGANGGSMAATTSDGYSGPGVLSRSYTLSRPMSNGQDSNFTGNVGVVYSADIGQAAGIASINNTYPSETTYSRSVSWGLNGRKRYSKDQFGLSYAGSYSDYTAGNLTGLNSTLNADWSHLITRRFSVNLVESLQLLSQNYGLENPSLTPGSSIANINLATSPDTQLPGNTVRQSSTALSVTYQQTGRLSYDLSTSYFLIGRTGVGFVSSRGEQLSADVNYRLTSKATVGSYYSFTNYQYAQHVSESDSHGVGGIFSYALNRRMQFRTRFGATRIETLGYETVPLPPELAFILGQGATIINAYNQHWVSDASAELVRDFGRNRTASLSYARGESPGNGVLLTSTQESMSLGYSMRLFRRVPVNLSASRTTLNSTSQGSLGTYSNETFSFSTSRQLRRDVQSSLTVDYRRYQIAGTPLTQHDFRVSFGVSWTPPVGRLLPF